MLTIKSTFEIVNIIFLIGIKYGAKKLWGPNIKKRGMFVSFSQKKYFFLNYLKIAFQY